MRLKQFTISLVLSSNLIFPQLALAQTSPTITLDSNTKYQIMTGWEATSQSGEIQSPKFSEYKDYLFDQAVNDLGINRLRVEIRSPKNVVDSPFDVASFDAKMDTIAIPFKQKLEARGEKLWLNVCVVGSELSANPTMYAQQVLATYQHIEQKYGILPDSWEVILEPDVFGWGNNAAGATKVGNAIKAAGDLLTANGYAVYFVAPSNTNTNNATATFIPTIKNMPGVMQYVKELSYHDYNYSPSDIASIKTTADQFGAKTAMLEHIGAPYTELQENLTIGGVSSWQQYTLAYPKGTDDGAQYYNVNNIATTPQTQITLGFRTKVLRQYFKYVRVGAQRIKATSTDTTLAPVAFINKDGKYTVVVKSTATGSFTVGNLPAGTYGIFYSTGGITNSAGNLYDVNLADQSISSGQTISASIPAAGAITIYAKSTAQASIQPSVQPSASFTQKPGDIDKDGDVDIFDYNQLLTDFGKTGTNLISDIEKTGNSLNKVDIFDFNLLVSNFGK